MHERRGLRSSIGEDNAPSSLTVKEDELPLRSASSSNFHSDSIRTHDDPNDPDSSVKRSLSDPKTSVHPRTREKRSGKSSKSRPLSMIQTSERDASWVFTEEKRNRSGSIPSDISDDSRRSSGIGDSFRSINSDGGGQVPRDGKTEIHSVQRLKKRFETGGEYHSDSSSSLASNSTHNDNNPVSRSNSNKRSNPDFTEQQHTIHEEEEHSLCNKSRVATNKIKLDNNDGGHDNSDSEEEEIFPSDGAETSRTLHGGDDVCDGKNYHLIDHSTQTDMYDKNGVSTSDKYTSNTDLISRMDAETDYEHVEWVNAGTSMRDDSTSVSIGVQCENNETFIRSVGSQYGDFIHLNGISDNNESSTDLRTNKLFYTENDSSNQTFSSKSTTPTPMMDALTGSLPERSISDITSSSENQIEKRGILKSLSDAHIPKLSENSVGGKNVEVKVIHSRSQSDEPKRVDSNSPKHSVAEESPGMKALMALSENLEELNQQRTSSTGSKTTSKHSVEGTSPALLRKAAMINSSPQLMRRTGPNEMSPAEEKQVVLRSNSTNGGQVWSSSPKQITKSVSEHDMYTSKRNTWHEFDSKKLLQGMHDAKFGKSERAISPVPEEGPKIERTFSKSTEQLHTPRKQKSFKKNILKKFATADAKSGVGVDREENVSIHTSSSDTSMDSKQMKKQMEKEKKEEKKRLKVCPRSH